MYAVLSGRNLGVSRFMDKEVMCKKKLLSGT